MHSTGCVNDVQIDVRGEGAVEGKDSPTLALEADGAASAPMWDPTLLLPVWEGAVVLTLRSELVRDPDPVPLAVHARQDLLDEDGNAVGELVALVEVTRQEGAQLAFRVHVLRGECRLELGEEVVAVDERVVGEPLGFGTERVAVLNGWKLQTRRGRTLGALCSARR